MAETETDNLQPQAARPERAMDGQSASTPETLRCQWCMNDLPAGETVCPSCGSPGVDRSTTVPDEEVATAVEHVSIEQMSDDELVEWWNDADVEEENTYKNSAEGAEDQMPVILGLIGTAIVCVVLGIVVAPIALASVFENSLGVTVENSNDLRPLGGILGLLIGAFIGAIGMWITAPRR
ncbi:hypothetical protein BH23CHL2_BH23CHL2_24560 [soil metagenome]